MPPVFASYWDELFFCTYASIDWAKLCIVSKLNKVSSYKEALRDHWRVRRRLSLCPEGSQGTNVRAYNGARLPGAVRDG